MPSPAHDAEDEMKYMLLLRYGVIEGIPPMSEWAPQDVQAHLDFYQRLNRELAEGGELVGVEALAGPEAVKIVTSDGVNAPLVSDGPFPEAKEFLAGYWMVDLDGEERALEIAARASAAPGPGGAPIRQPVEVRLVMGAPDPEM